MSDTLPIERTADQLAEDANRRELTRTLDKFDFAFCAEVFDLKGWKLHNEAPTAERLRDFVDKLAWPRIMEACQHRQHAGLNSVSGGRFTVRFFWSGDEWDDPQSMVFSCEINFVPVRGAAVCFAEKAFDEKRHRDFVMQAEERRDREHEQWQIGVNTG